MPAPIVPIINTTDATDAFPGALFVNESGIQIDPIKQLAMPDDVEIIEGYKEHFSDDGNDEATIYYQVPWAGRKAFVDWVMGYSGIIVTPTPPFSPFGTPPYTYGGGWSAVYNNLPAGGRQVFMQRVIPAQHPEMPWLYASDCDLEKALSVWVPRTDITVERAAGNQFSVSRLYDESIYQEVLNTDMTKRKLVPMVTYRVPDPNLDVGIPNVIPSADGVAVYRVIYRPRTYAVRSDTEMRLQFAGSTAGEMERYVTRRRTYATKTFQIPVDPNAPLTFTDVVVVPGDPIPIVPNANPVLFTFLEEWTYTWHDVPDIWESAIARCINRVNANAFDGALGFFPHDPETMLFLGAEVDRKPRSVRGRTLHTVKYKFMKNPATWNYFPDASGRLRPAAYINSASGAFVRKLYDSATMDELFQLPVPKDYQTVGHG